MYLRAYLFLFCFVILVSRQEVSVFSCFGLVFVLLGPVKEWLIIELHEMMKVSHKFACPNVFILLCDHGQHGGVLKLKTDDQF